MTDTLAYFRVPCRTPWIRESGEKYRVPLIRYITARPERVIHALPTASGWPAVWP